jgi:hypothetical protein
MGAVEYAGIDARGFDDVGIGAADEPGVMTTIEDDERDSVLGSGAGAT